MRRYRTVLGTAIGIVLALGALGVAVITGPVGTDSAVAVQSQTAVSVIVRSRAGHVATAEQCVASFGGRVTTRLPMIDSFVANVPPSALSAIESNPAVSSLSLNSPVKSSASPRRWDPESADRWYRTSRRSSSSEGNVYLDTVRAREVWAHKRGQAGEGNGVTIAVIDSGISDHEDFRTGKPDGTSRISASASLLDADANTRDGNGHGTHVTGILAGNGSGAIKYSGVAPRADVINLKAVALDGSATEADVLEALQWVYDNRETHGIRVVNLSVNGSEPQSYHESAIDAACEILWFNGVVVVASAGNSGPDGDTIRSAPANDPFIITVGATDEKYTSSRADDEIAAFSAFGTTTDGFRKPDILAPGRNIYAALSKDSSWARDYPERLDPSGKYFRLSGTSMSAPVVAGAVALLLEDEPSLTPDQVKYRLMSESNSISDADGATYPYLDAYKAVTGNTKESANTGTYVSQLLTTGDEPLLEESVMWRSVMWRSVMWRSVAWNSVMWRSVMWRSDQGMALQ